VTNDRVFLGLGANLGDREGNMLSAIRLLRERSISTRGVSSLYESPAVVPDDQHPGPDYLNAVCEVSCDFGAQRLHELSQEVESVLGRKPGPRWAPREIDVDLLLYGDSVISAADLVVPHPLITERSFVLAPLAELAAELVHPVYHATIAELLLEIDLSGLRHVGRWVTAEQRWAGDAPDAQG
jgi:2-amino-4-hydroxy-6-hydroxymethyldihydropteridine diphosphokinase